MRRRTGLERATTYFRAQRFDAPLLLSALPPEVPFGFVGRILPTTVPIDLRLELLPIPTAPAVELLHKARTNSETELAHGGGAPGSRPSETELDAESAQELGRAVAAREQELWRVGISFHALAPTRPASERVRQDLSRRLEALGFGVRVPEFEAWDVVRPPGLEGPEKRPAGYWHTLHTDGVAAFFPFSDETVVAPGGTLVGLLLDDASPVFLDRWSQSSHSWGIFGTTGSGKTFAAALFALRSRWMRPKLPIYLIDPLGEFAGLGHALGGTVLRFGPKSEAHWNPLDPAGLPVDPEEGAARVAGMLRALFPTIRDEERACLDVAARRLFLDPTTTPTFARLIETLPPAPPGGERLSGLLEIFRTGSLGYLSAPTNVSLDHTPTVVGLEGVPDDQLPFHLAYLLDALLQWIRARPGPQLILIDEAHRLVQDPGTATTLDRMIRTARHFGAGVMLMSQSPEDFLSTASGRSILANLRATLLLRQTRVSPEARACFQLTEAESEWLPKARLPREAGYSEGLLRSGPAHLPIAIVATTPEYEFLTGALAAPPRPS